MKLARVALFALLGLGGAITLAACVDDKLPNEQQIDQSAIHKVEVPQVNDQCDSTFSLPDCSGGYIMNGATCTFPNGSMGYCWSEGPRFEDGTWDCNLCIP